jgi:hypothetical protein
MLRAQVAKRNRRKISAVCSEALPIPNSRNFFGKFSEKCAQQRRQLTELSSESALPELVDDFLLRGLHQLGLILLTILMAGEMEQPMDKIA